MHGRLFQGAKCETIPKGNLECTQGLVLVSQMRAYEEEVEREPAKMTGSLEQLAELQEKEEEEKSGSETCLREY